MKSVYVCTWCYVVRTPGARAGRLRYSRVAHLFSRSIAICNLHLIQGPNASATAKRCRNCLRMKNAEVCR